LRPPSTTGQRYESKFGNWERRSSVRTKPVRIYSEGEPSEVFFPPELVPAASHPLVKERGPGAVHRLLVQALYNYLSFTVVLEQMSVIPVTGRIALGQSGLQLPAGMRADAFKITTDEAWHAQFCYDFVDHLEGRSGVPAALPRQPQFVRRLERVRESFDPADRRLVELVFATVSETLVSSFLAHLPNDKRLPRSVRAVVMDHAEDEGRHHAYFRTFLRLLWPQLSERERRLVGPRVPDLIEVFLQPDVTAVALGLDDIGLAEHEARAVVEDCYRRNAGSDAIISGSRATVASFLEVGCLDDPATYEAFAARGLVD
jgi:hypothetical protein